MRRLFASGALAVVLLMPVQALAWNHKGHMVVAYIAYQQFTPEEKARVFRTLKAHPDFSTLAKLAGSPKSSSYAMLLFIHAARWPDLIRNDARFYDETDPHADPTKRLKNFPDMKKHRPWHFKDEGFTTDGSGFSDPDHINAQTAIRAFRQSVGNPKLDLPHKAYFLAWLEHLVGDVHQPLHCVALFTRELPRGDRGGNLFKIAPYPIPGASSAPDNLHSFWDGVLGADTGLVAVRATAKEAEASSPTEDGMDLDEGRWIEESFEYAKSAAYEPLIGQAGTPQVEQSYFDNARSLALKRVKLAGHRLAALIKQELK